MHILWRRFEVRCYIRSNHTLSFHHTELLSVGFNATDLHRLSITTQRTQVKFQVSWDKSNNPHFNYQKGFDALLDKYSGHKLYHSFVKWCFNKTGIKGYRVIHNGIFINLLFNHSDANVDPFLSVPEYDFTGFTASTKVHQDGKVLLNLNLNTNNFRETVPNNPAIVRIRRAPENSYRTNFALIQ